MSPASISASQAYLNSLASNKELTLNYHRHTLHFRVSQELFSSYQVDAGTRLLLKTVGDLAGSQQVRKVLDLGCGYGPLGLSLAKTDPDRQVHLVDRDALAVAFTQMNAQMNDLTNVNVYTSLGYDDVQEDGFDLILSNIPGKAGHSAIASFLLGARRLLGPHGIVAIVVVPPLAAPTAEILDRPDVELLLREDGAEHVVFHYRFLPAAGPQEPFTENAFEQGVYDRDHLDVDFRGLRFTMQTVRGVPEFDELSHQTELLLSALQKKAERAAKPIGHALLFNPGQGHVPVALWKLFAPQTMNLAGRDLLALRASARNLAANGCPTEQFTLSCQAGLPPDDSAAADLILGILDDGEGPQANYALIKEAAPRLAPQGELMVAGASTTITRLEKRIKREKLLIVKQRKRNRAKRMLILRPR